MPQDLPPRPEPTITPEMCEACTGVHYAHLAGNDDEALFPRNPGCN